MKTVHLTSTVLMVSAHDTFFTLDRIEEKYVNNILSEWSFTICLTPYNRK